MQVLTVELTVDNKRLCFATIFIDLMIYNYFCCET